MIALAVRLAGETPKETTLDRTVEILTIIVLIGAALGAIVVMFKGVRGVIRFFAKINRFFDDWYGTEAKDGHPRVKGVLHRLDDLEEMRANDSEMIGEIKVQVIKELNRNGGSSAKDAAFEAVRVSKETLEAVQGVQLQLEEEVKERKHWVESFEAEQRTERRAMVKLVKKMIDLPKEEQHKVWDAEGRDWIDGKLGGGENAD